MTAVFIAVFVVLLVMIYFMTVCIQIVVEHSTKKVNTYFANKLNEFDEDFEEKVEKLKELEEEKVRLTQDIKLLELDKTNLKTSRFYKPRPIIRDIYIPTARYIDNEFFEDYKKAKNLLVMDKDEIIKTVMNKFPYTGNLDRYLLAKGIKEKINFDALYDMSTMPAINQLEAMDATFTEDEIELVKEFINTLFTYEDFQISEFIKYVENIMADESPILVAYTGEQGLDFTHISENIVAEYDDNICEGIRIIYQHRVYDYSIYQSRKKSEGGF